MQESNQAATKFVSLAKMAKHLQGASNPLLHETIYFPREFSSYAAQIYYAYVRVCVRALNIFSNLYTKAV